MAGRVSTLFALLLVLCMASSTLQNYDGSSYDGSSGGPSLTNPTYDGSSGSSYDGSSGGPSLTNPTYDGSSGSSYDGSSGGPSLTNPTVPISSGSGFTPAGRGTFSFWRTNIINWPNIISVIAKLVSIFGGRSGSHFPPFLTLKDAMDSTSDDAYTNLAQQATASLLNAYTVQGFAYTPQQVKAEFNAALDDPTTAAAQASKFAQLNEQV